MKRKLFWLLVIILMFASVFLSACEFSMNEFQYGVFIATGGNADLAQGEPVDWCAIIGDKMTVSDADGLRTFVLQKDKGKHTTNGNIAVSLSENTLTIDDNGQTKQYDLSGEYEYSEYSQESAIPVLEAETVFLNGKTYVSLTGSYDDYIADGIKVEIRKAGEEEYASYPADFDMTNGLSLTIPSDEFSRGDNLIRLCNSVEYPMIDDDKNLFMKSASGSIEYKVTVDENGNITYLQNNSVLENGVYEFAYSDEFMTAEEKDYCYLVVIDDMLTESFKGGKSIYYLSDFDGVYSMKFNTPDNNVSRSFTVKNGIITMSRNYTEKVIQFKKDDRYVYSEEPVVLEKPVVQQYRVENYYSEQYLWFNLFALDVYYPVGVKVEIKKADSADYEYYDIEVPYQAQIYVDGIGADNFIAGFNFVRICNVGAPVRNNNYKYYMTEDSDFVEFIVLLDETGIQVGPYFEEQG